MDITAYSIILNILSTAEVHLIKDVFKHKALNFGTLFHCQSANNAIYIQKMLNKFDLRISTFKMNNNEKGFMRNNDRRVGIILKTSCENWTQVFDFFDAKLFRGAFYSWLILTDNGSATTEALSTYPMEIDSDVTVITKTDGIFNLFEVYNSGFYANGRFCVQPVGYSNYKLRMKGQRRTDLSGVVLKMAAVVTHNISSQTFEEYLSRSKLEVDSVHKLKYFTLLKYLREMYNFSFVMQRTASWGYQINGSFDGMVGTLQRGETEIGGSPVFIRPDRAKYIDYVTATWSSKPCFIFRHPKHPGGFSTIYTRPLTDEVWCCILGLLLVASVLLCALLKLKAIRVAGDEGDSSASLALLSVWSSVCQQGMAVNKHASSVKLVLFTSILFSLTVYQYYNATVVSTLLRAPPVTIRSLEDLLHSKLKAGVEDTLYNKDYFRRTTDPVALKIFSHKIASTSPHNFFPPAQGMSLVKLGGFAFHADPAYAYPIIKQTFTEQEICDLQEVNLFPPQNLFAVTKKESPYRKHLSYGIRKMYEAGLMHRLKSIWDEPKPPCVRTPDSSIFTVTLREFSTPLIVLLVGMVAATMLFLAELMIFKMAGQRVQFRH